MKDKFLKYWTNMQELSAVGLVLDPRYKIQYLKYSLDATQDAQQSSELLATVRTAILTLASVYAPTQSPADVPAKSPTPTTKKINEDTFRFLQYMNGSSEGLHNDAPGA